MKTKRLFHGGTLLLLAMIGSFDLRAQTPQATIFEEWTSTAGSQNFFQKSVTKTDTSSNVYIAGATINSAGNYDILIAKYSPDGAQMWMNQYAGTGGGNDFATAIALDASGNVYITGSVLNTLSDSANVITIKYNSSGSQQWASTYHGGTGSDIGTGLVEDGSGNVYVCGTSNRGSTTKFDALLLKYNSSGTQQWVATYDYNSQQDCAYFVKMVSGKAVFTAAVQNSSTNYKLALVRYNSNGSFFNQVISGNNTIGFTMVYGCAVDANRNIYVTGSITGTSSLDYYTIKLDSALNQQWTATYNGSSNLHDESKGVVVDASGNVYVTGYSTTSTQGKDMVTIKYNSSGSQQWTRTYNGTPNKDDEGYAIAIDASGNPVVCGATHNGAAFDYYTAKYGAANTLIWQMTWNSAANRSDRAMDVAIDASGNVIVTGQSMTGAASYTYVTVKYSAHSVLTPTDSEPLLQAFCFTENRGQIWDTDTNSVDEIKFYNRENAGKQQLYFTDDRISYVMVRCDTSSVNPIDTLQRIDMTYTNSYDAKQIYPMNERDDFTNYFLGQYTDPFAKMKHYNTLFHESVYSGIDVMYSNNSRGLKYYYIITPGASTSSMGETYTGADTIYVDSNGDLVIVGELGTIRKPKPRVWEITSSGSTVSLLWQPTYNVSGNNVTYTLGSYNSANTLVLQVDYGNAPAIQQNPNDNLDWATHYGSQAGSGGEVMDTDTDGDGEVYYSGHTYANNFPVGGGVQTVAGGNKDGVILKFNNSAGLIWATFIGGPNDDDMYHIDVDTVGFVYFGGRTNGGIYTQTLAGAYNDNSHNGSSDWHLGKIDVFGSMLTWSTYYGGSGSENLLDMKITPLATKLYFVGNSTSSGFPIRTKTGAYNSGTGGAVIVEFDSALDTTWSVRFGTGTTYISAIDGNLSDGFYITGRMDQMTSTIPFVDPGGSAFYDTLAWNQDAFVVGWNSACAITWGTVIGGGNSDEGTDIALIGKDVVVVGSTNSAWANGFPLYGNVAAGEFKDSLLNSNNPDGFICRFGVNGVQKWTTFFGGNGWDGVYRVIADESETVYVSGGTASSNIHMQPYGNAYYQFPSLPEYEVFYAAFTPANHLIWSTCFGGSKSESNGEMATDGNEWLYIGGHSYSNANTFPWDYPIGGYIDTNKTITTYNAPYVGRFGIPNINVSASTIDSPQFGLNVFPNPTSSTSLLQISGLLGDNIEIVIVDMLGRVVYNRKIEGVFGTLYESVETSVWESGIYMVSVYTEQHGMVSRKLIKQ